jgi:lipid-binding SYLF domain-containing protein
MGDYALLVFCLVSALPLAAADGCDCSHFPIEKSCESKCAKINVEGASNILSGFLTESASGVPLNLAGRAKCFIVVPGSGDKSFPTARSDHGFAVCRTQSNDSGWTAPAAVQIKGGQNRSTTDDTLIMVMEEKDKANISGNRFNLGDDVSITPGPVGYLSDPSNSGGMFSYSRSRTGIVAGTNLTGAAITPDTEVNRGLYGRSVTNRDILRGAVPAPSDALELETTLKNKLGR